MRKKLFFVVVAFAILWGCLDDGGGCVGSRCTPSSPGNDDVGHTPAATVDYGVWPTPTE